MPAYQVKIVDAFTSRRYAGNPCGVVSHAEGLSDAQMQAIARELNLSETAFVFPSDRADFRVRFFTPATEIPLAGHPTIATMHALVEEGRIPIGKDRTRVTQELNVGVLPVDIERNAAGDVRVLMTQAKPSFLQTLERDACAQALGIGASDMLAGVPVQVVSTGTPQAMIPVASLAVLQHLKPDLRQLGAMEGAGGYFSTHVFALDAFEPPHRAHARHFAASAGAMAAYLWKHGLLRDSTYTVEQGHIMGRPGIVEVEVDADGGEPVSVRVGGTAITVLRGTIEV